MRSLAEETLLLRERSPGGDVMASPTIIILAATRPIVM
jgi:hypothetical protein